MEVEAFTMKASFSPGSGRESIESVRTIGWWMLEKLRVGNRNVKGRGNEEGRKKEEMDGSDF